MLATGVQVLTDSGWTTIAPELDHRGQIWQLKPGTMREFCVGRPRFGAAWRPYVRYAGEMKGARKLYWQPRGAWAARSFSNWTGKAWGNGLYGGDERMLVGEAIEDWRP